MMKSINKKSFVLLLAISYFGVMDADAQRLTLPQFEDYPVSKIFKGQQSPVDFRSHPKAKLFRTRLLEGSKGGPNFAGHYTVVMWGCGSDCVQVAVIDVTNGRVYFAPFTVTPSMRADFRLDSRLFIQNPPERNNRPIEEEMLDVYKPGWYVWRENRFVKLPIKIKYKRRY